MSKSIKDYREAMDNIKISDSFCKRTETLLSELPETKLTPVSPVISLKKWIPTVLTAAAACFIFIFGIRLVIDSGSEASDISTETITVTVTEISVTETTSAAAAPLVDELEGEDDFEKLITEAEQTEKEKAKTEKEAGNKTDNENNKNGKDETAAETEKASSVTAAEPQSVPKDSSAGNEETVEDDASDETSYGQDQSAGGKAEKGDFEEETDEELSEESGSNYEKTGFAASMLMPAGVNYNSIITVITPYFDMDAVKSGKTKVTSDGNNCKDIIDFISDAVSRASVSEDVSDPPASGLKFRLDISEAETGKGIYGILVAENGRVVIDSENGKKAFVLGSADSEVLEHILFLRFAAEDDYEKYLAIK